MQNVSAWRKSSRSNSGGGGNCVEVRRQDTGFHLRDSKLGDNSPLFGLGERDLVALIRTL